MRICFIGDSFVNGTGDPQCLGWAGRVCAAANSVGHDITYYNLGIRRQTSTQIKLHWLQEVSCRLSNEFDSRIVFSFGVNDTTIEARKTRVEFTDSVENTRHILATAKQLFPILMVSPPPVVDIEQNLRIHRLSTQFALVCQALNVPYLDVFTPLQASPTWCKEAAENDGAHPRADGYTEFAQLVQSWSCWLAWFK